MSSATSSKTNQIRTRLEKTALDQDQRRVAADGNRLKLYDIWVPNQLPGAVAEKIETPGTWNCKTENFNMPC